MTVFGVDVSYHQGSINWGAVRSDGIGFATIKASAGTRAQSPDSGPYFRSQFPRARAAGVPLIGGYHWLRSGNVAAQVSYFLDQWAPVGGYEGRIVQLDWEDLRSGSTLVDRPSWSTGKAWLAEWRRRTNNYPVVIYLPDWFYPQIPGRPSSENLVTLGCPIWASEYASGGDYRANYPGDGARNWHGYGGITPSILQYSSAGRVNGISGGCDVNAYRGTLDSLRSLLTTGGRMFSDLDLY